MTPDLEKACGFLRRWPTKIKHLVAIELDPITGKKAGHTHAMAFTQPVNYERVAAWIAEQQAEHKNAQGQLVRANVYFTVNELMRPTMKKAAKADMAQQVALQIDIDLDGGNEGEENTARLDAIIERLMTNDPQPTAVLRSGGGGQGFWVINEEDRVSLDGDAAKCTEAERYTIALQKQFTDSGFKADTTHNVDRIMRLPYTLNIPDDKKLAKGRKIAIAELVHFDPDMTYPLARFPKAAGPERAQGKQQKAAPVDGAASSGDDDEDAQDQRLFTPSSFEPKKFYDPIDEDDSLLSALEQDMIMLARDGDLSGKFVDSQGRPDRSKALYSFAIECKRLGVDDEALARVIMDPRWRIGECVRDKGAERRRHLRRTIQRATEAAFDPDLAKFNNEYALIRDLGGKSMIMHERVDPATAEEYVTYASFESFINGYIGEMKTVGTDKKGNPRRIAKTKWWLNSKYKRAVMDVRFMPGIENIPGYYNIWRGFTVDADEGPNPEERCGLYLKHVKENICGGDEKLYRYVICWMAKAVQNPNDPAGAALVLRGRKGTGKGSFAQHFGFLFGPSFVPVTKAEHVTGQFNGHMGQCIVLFADECFFPGDHRHEQILKILVTEPTWLIERKGIDAMKVPSHLHIIIACNDDWSVPTDEDERRFCCIAVGDAHRRDRAYFKAIDAQMKAGGYEALLGYLQGVDIQNFNQEDFPVTDEHLHQMALTRESRDGVAALIEDACHEGELPFSLSDFPYVIMTSGKEDGLGFDNWVETRAPPSIKRKGTLRVKNELMKVWGCKSWRRRVGESAEGKGAPRVRGIEFPELAELRATFAKRFGVKVWQQPQVVEWQARGGVRLQSGGGAGSTERQATVVNDNVPF